MIERVAAEAGGHAALQPGSLLIFHVRRGALADAVDSRLLKAILEPGSHATEGEPVEAAEPQLLERVRGAQREAGRATREAVELEPPVEEIDADGERAIEEPWLGEADLEVLPDRAE